MRRRIAALCLAGTACGGGDAAPLEVTRGRLTARLEPDPARIELRVDDTVVWTTTPGARVSGSDPPLGFGGVGAGTARIETMYGSFRFDDQPAPWQGIDTLGELVATEDGAAFTLRSAGDVVGTGELTFEATAGGADPAAAGHPRHVRIRLATEDGTRMSLATPCGADEHFVGLGGQSWDVDHRGQTVPLWVQEDGITKSDLPDDDYTGVWFLTGRRHSTHTPMPMLLSSAGYALAVDTGARATFALCSEDPGVARYEAWDPVLDLQVFVGAIDAGAIGAVRDSLAHMIAWVGTAPRPPLFAFAPWVDAIFGEANVLRVAQRLRADGIAASVIWTEDWRGGADSAFGYALEEDWRVDRVLYPNFEVLADDLHGLGYKFFTYYNTFVDETADVYAEAIAGGYVAQHPTGGPYLFDGVTFNPTALVDLTNPAARAWAREVITESITLGADGWMADFAEWLPTDAVLADGDALAADHNRYPVQWAELNRDVLAAATDGAPRLTFLRAAWLHSQPLVQVLWMGDQQTDFTDGDGMPSVIPMMIGLGVTGFPYVGHDIAGYMSQFTVPTTEEVWYRWVTLGALSPVMRTHHGRDARLNYQWENDAGSVAHFRRWTRLHMQLVPYLAGLVDAYERDGLPLVRLAALHHPDLDWAWTATDQYFLGDRILVAPVVRAGAASRAVQLPPGTWYPLLGGAGLAGDREVTIDAGLTEIPALVPEGSILVLFPDGVDTVVDAPASAATVTADDIGPDRDVWLYPGASGPTSTWTEGARQLVWAPRDGTLPAPTAATWDGVSTPISGGVVTVTGNGTLAYAGGGELVVTGGDPAAQLAIRLRSP
jgi:alpha-glucosidase (family GH31 glycosyl hydrolase)